MKFLLPLFFLFWVPKCYAQQFIKHPVITWDFFRNDKPSTKIHDAFTLSHIDYKWTLISKNPNQIKIKFSVFFSLDTAASYFNFEKKYKTPDLLQHEQGHADLVYIYACKLLHVFNSTKYTNNYEAEVKRIYNDIYAEAVRENVRYDTETNHSMDKNAQEKWNRYLRDQLNQRWISQ